VSIHHRQRQVVLPRVVPNAGLQAYYRKRLDRLIEAMHDSVAYWVAQAYRANPPEIAQDESPAVAMRRLMRKLASRWNREFDKLARKLSPEFVRRNGRMSDTQFIEHLKAAGFTVEFSVSRQVNDVMQAAIGENVALIKSIPQQYLTQVEGMVLRSVQAGRDLSTLSKDLQHQYGVTRRRAALIARDQNNKATSAIYRARQVELGIEEAIWHHSHAGKTPRPAHVAMNGKTYKVSEGMWDEDEQRYVFPGQLISCRCTAKSIIRGFM
jgi:SPP1 gp7 family putative phage head morphogenesis protein